MPLSNAAALARRAYQAYNSRDFDAAAALCAHDLVLRNASSGDEYRGRDGYLQWARAWAAAFPDSRLEVTSVGGDEATVVVEYTLRGTHTGSLVGPHGHIPPTWVQVDLPVCDAVEVRDGEIVSVRSYFDTGTLLRQMGLLPSSPLHAPDRRAPLDLYALEVDVPASHRNRAVVQRFVDAVLNAHDPGAAPEVCAPNLAWHGGPLGELRDAGSFQHLIRSLLSSFPDLSVELQESIAEGDRVAARLAIRGTHRGDFQGIPPTGTPVVSSAVATFRVVEGKIVELWWQHDLFSLMKQLDVLPAMVRLSSAADL